MKTVKLSLALVALSLGIAGAFAENIQHKAVKSTDDNLVWYKTISDTNPNPDLASTQYPSAEAAAEALGCSIGEKFCAAEFDLTTQTVTGERLQKP